MRFIDQIFKSAYDEHCLSQEILAKFFDPEDDEIVNEKDIVQFYILFIELVADECYRLTENDLSNKALSDSQNIRNRTRSDRRCCLENILWYYLIFGRGTSHSINYKGLCPYSYVKEDKYQFGELEYSRGLYMELSAIVPKSDGKISEDYVSFFSEKLRKFLQFLEIENKGYDYPDWGISLKIADYDLKTSSEPSELETIIKGFNGGKIEKSLSEAENWYLKAAKNDSKIGLMKLGEWAENGQSYKDYSIIQDLPKAISFYRRAFEVSNLGTPVEVAEKLARIDNFVDELPMELTHSNLKASIFRECLNSGKSIDVFLVLKLVCVLKKFIQLNQIEESWNFMQQQFSSENLKSLTLDPEVGEACRLIANQYDQLNSNSKYNFKCSTELLHVACRLGDFDSYIKLTILQMNGKIEDIPDCSPANPYNIKSYSDPFFQHSEKNCYKKSVEKSNLNLVSVSDTDVLIGAHKDKGLYIYDYHFHRKSGVKKRIVFFSRIGKWEVVDNCFEDKLMPFDELLNSGKLKAPLNNIISSYLAKKSRLMHRFSFKENGLVDYFQSHNFNEKYLSDLLFEYTLSNQHVEKVIESLESLKQPKRKPKLIRWQKGKEIEKQWREKLRKWLK